MTKSHTVIVSAQLPTHTVEQLRNLAQQADRSLSAEIRRAVHMHLRTTNGEPK